MLISLHIKNLALADDVAVDFSPGMNALTGETGAGKSIVVDALNLAIGGRAERDSIRDGCDFARVDAVFDVSKNAGALTLLDELGLHAENGEVIMSREISAAGRSSCRILGSPATLTQLRELTGRMIDIHGQHEHQQLMDSAQHMRFLDAFGGADHVRLCENMQGAYANWRELSRALDALSIGEQESRRRMDALNFQLSEITAAKVKPDEDAALEKQRLIMRNAERIALALSDSYAGIYANTPSAQAQIKDALNAFSGIAGLDDAFASIHARLSEAYYIVQDIGHEIRDAIDGDRFDPKLAEKVEARLDKLNRLKRKYGPTLNDVIAFRERVYLEIDGAIHRDEETLHLTKQCEDARGQMAVRATALSQSRAHLAQDFSVQMAAQLTQLGMVHARFMVEITPDDGAYTQDGCDAVRFLFSANMGESLRALNKVASGGEISRVMLALKTINADKGGVPCMVFDEADAGISGYTAQAVGGKMATIARDKQVICVTHLAQIACNADTHLFVEKSSVGLRTVTEVRQLTGEDRAREIARMAGGSVTDAALIHAREMLTGRR